VTVPLWLEEPRAPLRGRRWEGRVDAAVVGGGVTGCAAALTLARSGLRVRLHEVREIAGGASGRNGGFALRGAALPYDRAARTFGRVRSATLWRLTEAALATMAELAGDAFRPVGSLRLAAGEEEAAALRDEYEALLEDGFEAEWVEPLPERLGARYGAGLRHPTDGALQPARWVRRLAALAAAAGADIRERSRVGSLSELDAEAVVVATDGSAGGLLPGLARAVVPTRGQVVATEPLPELLYPLPHYARRGFDYWQQLPDRRLVYGGRRDAALEEEWTAVEETTATVQAAIEQALGELLGFRPPITHRWAGIWGTTPDLLPLVGELPGRPGVWLAAGYSGHGNVLGLACGELVGRALAGERDPLLELFDPGRFGP
jgi:gamma-glutamylputrescine oxidase